MSKRKQKDSSESVNSKIVEMLLELSEYENNVTRQRFKAVAYRKAAGVIAKHPTPIKSGDEAKELSGIGVKIAQKIDEFLKSGKLEKLEKIRASDENVSIQELTKVMGIGPANARTLYEEGITSIEELRKHPEKLNHHQKLGLKYFEDLNERIPRQEMEMMEEFVVSTIQNLDSEYKATICGSYRRGAKSSGDIDVLLTHPTYTSNDEKNPDLLSKVVTALSESNFITDTISHGDTKFMGICRMKKPLEAVNESSSDEQDEKHKDGDGDGDGDDDDDEDGIPPPKVQKKEEKQKDEASSSSTSDEQKEQRYRRIDIRVIPHDQYWCGVLYFTGSDEFNRAMRKEAQEKGFIEKRRNEYSVRKLGPGGKPGEPLPVHSEEDIFRHLKMKFVAPKDRNN